MRSLWLALLMDYQVEKICFNDNSYYSNYDYRLINLCVLCELVCRCLSGREFVFRGLALNMSAVLYK